MDIFTQYSKQYKNEQKTVYTLQEYLNLCKKDKMTYASAAERMVASIGEAEIVDTSSDPRLSRIFQNRTVKIYPAFRDFYGNEEVVERIVGYFKYAAQGLEEKKQILYLLGPVGGGKSSIAERLKVLMEKYPIYILAVEKDDGEIIHSKVFESPLGLFNIDKYAESLEKEYGIGRQYLTGIMSPWAVKRLDEMNGDISKFKVIKIHPSKLRQIAVVKTEPGDDNNQDISSLVGKVDIRQLEYFSQNDPDAYSFSGALCRGNQGILEFVEMFKAPLKVLNPLLTATQEGNYMGTEGISAIPFQGIVVAHSNEAEWQTFKGNKNNEAFIDRICVIKVPYCLRVDEEEKIYKKMLTASTLKDASCAPEVLKILAQFFVLTRLKDHENSTPYAKMRVYNGENLKDVDPKAKAISEYKDTAGVDEGMLGVSTRFAFKVLSNTFNFDSEEVAADPVHLMYVLEQSIKREQFGEETENTYMEFIKEYIAPKYAEFIGKEIQKAYLESYHEYGQNLFDKYIEFADHWCQDKEYKDPDTGNIFDRKVLDTELEKTERAAGITNAKDFRNEVVNFVLRAKSKTKDGKNPSWTSYEKLREVIEKRIFSATEDLMPVITFGSKKDGETDKKHHDFVDRMVERGYSPKQVRRLVEWFIRFRKNS